MYPAGRPLPHSVLGISTNPPASKDGELSRLTSRAQPSVKHRSLPEAVNNISSNPSSFPPIDQRTAALTNQMMNLSFKEDDSSMENSDQLTPDEQRMWGQFGVPLEPNKQLLSPEKTVESGSYDGADTAEQSGRICTRKLLRETKCRVTEIAARLQLGRLELSHGHHGGNPFPFQQELEELSLISTRMKVFFLGEDDALELEHSMLAAEIQEQRFSLLQEQRDWYNANSEVLGNERALGQFLRLYIHI
jgi:hypothetical protein